MDCVLTVVLTLTGCAATPQELAARDDAKCQGYGAAPVTSAYVTCRSQLDAARTQARATALAGF